MWRHDGRRRLAKGTSAAGDRLSARTHQRFLCLAAGRAPTPRASTLDELQANLREVVELLLADGEAKLETEFVGRACRMRGLGAPARDTPS
jgi:hypothetical protein